MAPPELSHSSRSRLTSRLSHLFPSESLFDRLARVVCEAECLPRKELFEAWEMARRVRRTLRGGRVVDLAAGHGLLAWALLLLDDTSQQALCVDRRRPASAERLAQSLVARWPRLEGRVEYVEEDLAKVELGPEDLVVSAHACGSLTDRILEQAVKARARVAVLPCCHHVGERERKREPLEGWLAPDLAQDIARAHGLQAAGYRVRALAIPGEITPKNRLLIGEPE
ncbi:MAG: methyltransferase [Deltaproteobacteria bacterium]|nr:methyltransferase [Deltaproteobacteria bacterium]